VERLPLFLQRDVLPDGAEVVAQVQLAGGLNAAEVTLRGGCFGGHGSSVPSVVMPGRPRVRGPPPGASFLKRRREGGGSGDRPGRPRVPRDPGRRAAAPLVIPTYFSPLSQSSKPFL